MDENDDIASAVLYLSCPFKQYRETEAVRLCLKHLRQHNYTDVFDVLLRCSNVRLEDPLLTRLHDHLVQYGNFDKCEEIISDAARG